MDKKKVTGRKPLEKNKKRQPIKIYLNGEELEKLNKRKGMNSRSLSEYLREIILEDSKKPSHINPVDFLKDIKVLSMEVNKIGVNINQLARHLNELRLQGVIPTNVSDAINDKIESYLIQQDLIISKLKEVIKK